MNIRLFILCLLCVGIFACNNKPIFPIEPHIEYIDMLPLEVSETSADNKITIQFSFTDGDGDLGDEVGGDKTSLIVIDNRTQFPDSLRTFRFQVPDLRPNTKKPSIMGKMSVEVLQTPLTPGTLKDSTSFTVYILDQAGHKSNEIVTDKVYIKP